MAGYIRQDVNNNIETGNIVDAADFDNEFNALQGAFNVGNGHRHNGVVGEGAPITVIGPSQEIQAEALTLRPNSNNVVNLGNLSFRWKDGWFGGTVTADVFTGNGANLTGISASNLLTGTLPSARLTGSYTGITGTGILVVGQIGVGFGNINIGTNTFTGNGSGLTNLNAGNIATGTIPSARMTGSYTGITGVGVLAAGSITTTFGNINIGSSTFTGNGSGITNLNASNVSSGTLSTSRLPVDDPADEWVGARYANVLTTDVGNVSLMKNLSGATLGTGDTAPGDELRYSSTSGNEGGTPSGIWKCMSQTPNNAVGLFKKVVA